MKYREKEMKKWFKDVEQSEKIQHASNMFQRDTEREGKTGDRQYSKRKSMKMFYNAMQESKILRSILIPKKEK